MHIRQFASGDTQAVISLWREAFPQDPARNDPHDVIARKVARDPELFWVADDGEVAGVVMAGYDGVRGWLYHLAVATARRGEGIGGALTRHAVDELKALGCPKVNLQVRRSNEAVVEFYASQGWVEDECQSYGLLL